MNGGCADLPGSAKLRLTLSFYVERGVEANDLLAEDRKAITLRERVGVEANPSRRGVDHEPLSRMKAPAFNHCQNNLLAILRNSL
jgi:hypothetical protein